MNRRCTTAALMGLACGAAVVLAGACTGSEATAQPSARTQALQHADSIIAHTYIPAGVSLVTNPAPDLQSPALRLAALPTIKVGGRNDDSVHKELWDVYDAVLTSGNRLVVSMDMGREVRVFDTRNAHVKSIGRVGEGPGEFARASQLFLTPGDSLIINDRNRGAVTLYAPDDAPVRVTTAAQAMVCCFPDGAFLSRGREYDRSFRLTWPERRAEVTWSVAKLTASAAQPTDVLILEDEDNWARAPRQSWLSGYISRKPPAIITVPFSRVSVVRVAGNNIIHGTGDAFQYNVYSRDGKLVRVVRVAAPAKPVTAPERAEARKIVVSLAESEYERRSFAKVFDETPLPVSHPAYDAMRTEEDGSVWTRLYQPRRMVPKDAPDQLLINQTWVKFDSAGKLVGALRIPDGHSVIRFTRGNVVLRHRQDSDGFAYVLVYPIMSSERR